MSILHCVGILAILARVIQCNLILLLQNHLFQLINYAPIPVPFPDPLLQDSYTFSLEIDVTLTILYLLALWCSLMRLVCIARFEIGILW